jgi:anthranilate phosphoribosyltransferase
LTGFFFTLSCFILFILSKYHLLLSLKRNKMTTELQLREFGHLICSIAAGNYMTRTEATDAYRQVILNEQPELQQGAFLMAHIARGPSTEELAGAWDALDQYDTAKIDIKLSGPVADIVGTGSDALKTVNCSTPAALIAAACGLPIAKKGARLVTGVSGASDIFESWGVDLNAPLERATQCLEQHQICYLPGETFLQAGWGRLIKSMRFTSAFNIIGPLTRPCDQVKHIVIGAYAPHVCDQLIDVLKEIGMDSAVAPFGMADGEDKALGMDEFSTAGPTRVVELLNGKIETYEVTPADLGVKQVSLSQIASHADAAENSRVIMATLQGKYETPIADFFCVNAGSALYISGLVDSYEAGTEQAKNALANGKAYEKLQQLLAVQGNK